MVKYNIEREFHKISGSFGKVKLDMNKLYSLLTELQSKVEEQEYIIRELKEQVESNSGKILKTPKSEDKIIVGNIESKKFHYANCPYAKNIKGDNKIVFDGIEQAVKAGYNECACIRE